MRLSQQQCQSLSRTLHHHFGDDAACYVFGSRLDDNARGGDLDVFVETTRPTDYHQRARALMQLQDAVDLPIDLVVKDPLDCERPIHAIARLSGERIG
ncbi:nucleotidyltransferase domain-containing protein [Dechloromonas sp.]|uniref:nucleotidyltransferase domain-containing protein n=1 Tax=Dechloromonas sp. TaxID=1917218 RepID=UPI002170C1FD|nr:nucleotidyltransferase domain-containing protein [Dechloromonas sp.]MBU3697406.1 nucleotidyltransferase domain-containing protein [Dechloromonas sp.]